jgi:hypothetical protein
MEATSGLIFCWLYSNILLRWDFDAKAQHSWKLPRDWTPKEAKRIRSDLADFPAFLISQLDLQAANGQSNSSGHKFDYETALIRGRLLRLQRLD